MKSPSTRSPPASTASTRSPSPSKARPRSKPSAATVSCRAPMCVDPQPALMLVPSGSANSTSMSAPDSVERQGRGPEHGPVGAVHGDLEAAEIERDAAHDVPHVALHGALEHLGAAEPVAGQRAQVVVGDVRFDLRLFLVAELEAGGGEELDAVVGVRVVRGADDDAGGGGALAHQRGEPRRREHAGDLHPRAAAGEARHQAGLEHGPAEARVAADDEQRMRAALLGQHDRGGAADLHRELGSEQLAGDAADAVSAEVGAHGRRWGEDRTSGVWYAAPPKGANRRRRLRRPAVRRASPSCAG